MKRSLATLFAVPVLIAGCAAPRPVAVTDPETRVQLPLFSVLPPSGSHWWVDYRTRGGVWFAKVDPAYYRTRAKRSHTLLAVATAGTLPASVDIGTPAALEHEIVQALVPGSKGRFHMIEERHALETTQGIDCARFEVRSHETDNPLVPGVTLDMKSFGRLCRHPTQPGVVVFVSCSERLPLGHPSLIDDALRAECAHMIDSVQFGGR